MSGLVSSPGDVLVSGSGTYLIAVTSGVIHTGATAIAATDIADQRIVKRSGTSASVSISGTYSGYPASIQAKVVAFGTNTTVVNWTTIATAPSGGTFSGSLTVPQGGWYSLMVRDGTSGVSSLVSWSGANKWSVGELVMMLGQSNLIAMTQGWGNFVNSDDLTRITGDGLNWSRAGWYNPNLAVGATGIAGQAGTLDNNSPGGFVYGLGGGAGITNFLNALRVILGVPVGAGIQAIGGTDIFTFCSTTGMTPLVSNLLSNMGGAVTTLYHQGETETNQTSNPSNDPTVIAYVKSMLRGLLIGLRSYDPNMSLGQTIIGPSENYSPVGGMGTIRQAKLEFANENASAGGYIAGSIFDAQLSGNTGPHYDNTATAHLVDRI
jgi:hypothetical protein